MNRSMQSILHEEMNKFWWQEEASIKGKVLLLWPSARQIEMLFNKFSVCIIITKYNEMKRSYYKSKWRRSSRLYRKTFSNSIYMMMVGLRRRELISFIDSFCITEKPSNKVYKVHEDNFFWCRSAQPSVNIFLKNFK